MKMASARVYRPVLIALVTFALTQAIPDKLSFDNYCIFNITTRGNPITEAANSPNCTSVAPKLGVCRIENEITKCGPILRNEYEMGTLYMEVNPDMKVCYGGAFLPLFPSEFLWNRPLRILLYSLAMIFCFLGIAIISDNFMAAIEVITSKEKVITIEEHGKTREIHVLVWNATIANLSLMALGSSAPEILLAVLETCQQLNRPPPEGGLGPSTIVGSAAFNLLAITAVCVSSIPDKSDGTPGLRKVKELEVFMVTSFFSIFAYLWMYIVVYDNKVELWEAIVTFSFFPLMLIVSFAAEKGFIGCGRKSKVDPMGRKYIPTNRHNIMSKIMASYLNEHNEERMDENITATALAEGKIDQFVHDLTAEMMDDIGYSPLRYRMNATRFLTGGRRLRAGRQRRASLQSGPTGKPFLEVEDVEEDSVNKESKHASSRMKRQFSMCEATHKTCKILLGASKYAVNESAGFVEVQVVRSGYLNSNHCVQWETRDGTALAGEDYERANGILFFPAVSKDHKLNYGTEIRTIRIKIIDDDIFEPDENFYITLSKPSVATCQKLWRRHLLDGQSKAQIVQNPNNLTPAVNRSGTIPETSEKDEQPDKKTEAENLAIDDVSDFEASTPTLKPIATTTAVPEKDHLNIKFGEYDLGPNNTEASITIVNDDNSGEFFFERPSVTVVAGQAKTVKLNILRTNGCDGRIEAQIRTAEGTATGHSEFVPKKETITFLHGEIEKQVEIELRSLADPNVLAKDCAKDILENATDESTITDDTVTHFSVELSLPNSPSDGATYGEHRMCKVSITKDPKYVEIVDQVSDQVAKELRLFSVDTSSWTEQFKDALSCSGEEPGEEPSTMDYFLHFLSIGWKVLFALVPPTDYGGGWVAFFVSLTFIGVLTAIVADIASTFGCLLGLPDAVTAISFVALGTSLPDMFASRTAAGQDEHADASVGNVTGSNSVNVFLGLGLPWAIATIVHTATGYNDGNYTVYAGDLAFSITVFCPCAVLCLGILFLRRLPAINGGELGGNKTKCLITSLFLFSLWMLYVLLSSLCAIKVICPKE